METLSLMLLSIISLVFLFVLTLATDTIYLTESIREGRTLVSKGGSFELGFFSPGSSKTRYLGIWYKNDPARTVVWVANRQNPINGSSGTLMINNTGHLVLLAQNISVVWSANQTRAVQNPTLQLLDTGNLVLRDDKYGKSENYLWQSFDYPCDTLLPEMKLGWDLKSGLERRISSWKSSDDPSLGDFTWGIQLHSYPETVMWKGSEVYYRGGPWNGLRFTGAPELKPNPLFEFKFVSNKDEVYYVFQQKNASVMSRIVLNQTKNYLRERFVWSPETRTWEIFASVPRDNCDKYGLCGAYGNCVIGESPICQCLKGFKPKSAGSFMDWSAGCVHNKPLSCQDRDKAGFAKLAGLKLPDTTRSRVDLSLNLRECEERCLSNCSCTAYSNSDIRGKGSGCVMWFGDLIDIRQFPGSGGQDLYIRLHSSEIDARQIDRKVKIVVTVLSVILAVFGMLLVGHYIRRSKTTSEETREIEVQNNEAETSNMELPLLDLPTIANATDNFSNSSKIGEGGFGPVYKGILADGQEIAVKRLSKSSGQGLNEFKNEVILISKLQHRNLVKLLGCCTEGEEKMLIYEYMQNKSLDYFIFDQTRGKLLDWPKRFHIICGIARGLLYLHQDSRLRIVHRDLKVSNVLLDKEMNPKISDFGLARTFGGDQSEGNTRRVVGTYGYMAPEYAIDGLFSVKSDVFSFGILLLEIVTGKKNRGLYHLEANLNLIRHAWKLWNEGGALGLIDPCLEVSCDLSEALRCIHVSLLCVQEHPEDRPTMSHVVIMLSQASALPEPKQPGFSMGKDFVKGADSSSTKHEFSSTNEMSLTLFEAR
ncbi:hypothetical protein UlMin_004274 [Ulmus minor]